ncbi:MAG: 5,10-methylenetetrahydromethanopterin reductase [Actinomycetota bacterium]|nr:5,10-methylenetetrahydromethanopterin reductase [Actinomycetota bacterium]
MRPDPLPELGFYGLPGHSTSPADLLDECRDGEDIGLGACFLSERFNVKELGALSGAACAVTDRLGVATGVTNHNTRHPHVTAAWATTLHRMSGGRFGLGFGRGFDAMFSAIGLSPVTMAQLDDMAGLLRRLWHGETILGHDGPAGKYPFLRLDETFDEDIPLLLAALGPKTMTFGGRVFDGVILHTFFTDNTLAECVERIRGGAEAAGRDPASVRVWAVLAVLCDLPEAARMRMLVGRMATYLQAYGDVLVSINGWDPQVLTDFRAAPVVQSVRGAIDAVASPTELEAIAELIPDEWLAASAVGSPEHVAARIEDQLAAGADGVILHASTPAQLAPAVAAYRAKRPADRFAGRSTNPGR